MFFIEDTYTFYLENFAQGAQVMKNRCTFSFRTAETLRYSHADVFYLILMGKYKIQILAIANRTIKLYQHNILPVLM